jgi:hypothetical protein
MSAYAHVYQGQHDYNKHPFVPIGMESLVHVKLHKQQTYAQHCNKGYIIGTSFKHYQCQKVWMKNTHATRVSGAVWFKHKYLTNPSIIPEDQIVAAIGRLAKTLTTGVPPQLHNNMVDKLCKLQETLESRMDVNDERKITAPMQQVPIPRQSPRLAESNNHNPAAVPRVAWEYAMLPRVLGRMDMDTRDRSSPQQPDCPRQLSRISKLQKKIDAANMGNLHLDKGATSPQSSPAQNTHSKTMVVRPNCITEVRTIKKAMVLACIETYIEVTQSLLQPAQLAQQKFPILMLNAVLNNDTGKLMVMQHLLPNPKYIKLWGKLYTKELGQLAKGVSGTKGTDTIVFIRYNKIPLDRRRHITYGKTVVTYRPEKDSPNQTRLTVGGNRIVHHGNVSTPMVKMMTVKMHLNSVISTKGAGYCTFDLKDFYLNTPMERP